MNESRDTFGAESAVAGSILISRDGIQRAMQLLGEEDFLLVTARDVFRAAKQLHAEGGAIDAVTILRRAQANGSDLTREQVAAMMEQTPTAANLEEYAKIVADSSRRRALWDMAEALNGDTTSPTDALISTAQDKLEALIRRRTAGTIASSSDMMSEFLDNLERRAEGKRNTVSTGFKQLDNLLSGGLVNSGLYILAARPGMGKTTVALQMAERMGKHGSVLFVSLEMNREQLSAKRLSAVTSITATRLLMSGDISDDEFAKIASGTVELNRSGLCCNAAADATLSQIGIMARSLKDCQCIIVDYLGLVKPEERSRDLYQQTSEISHGLKALAKQLDVPVLALSQLNRGAESRNDKKPTMADLRDSGAIEQDADGVMLLFRPDYYDKGAERKDYTPSLIVCDLAKNRHGRTGEVCFNAYLAVNKVW